jgi:hypothetical protein
MWAVMTGTCFKILRFSLFDGRRLLIRKTEGLIVSTEPMRNRTEQAKSEREKESEVF